MIAKAFVVVVAVWASALAAAADDTTPDDAGGRYIFNKTAEGFVRLDTKSGEVALCSQRSVGWACVAAPEDRAVLENEIARLRSENAALKKDILARGLPLPQGAMPEPPVAPNGAAPPPRAADVDRVMAFVGRAWRRLVEAIEKAQKQVLNRS
jgi:hypothetical protein